MVAANAQVYSVNVVGYVTVNISGDGFRILSVPLISTNTTLSTLIPAPPNLARMWWYDTTPPGAYKDTQFEDGIGWYDDFPLAPGQGFYFKLNYPSDSTSITFVGEVAEKTASNKNLPAGMSLQGSLVPQQGTQDDPNTLNLPGNPPTGGPTMGSRIWVLQNGIWKDTQFEEGVGWYDSFTIGVAEGFWYQNNSGVPIQWNRNFTVPQ